MNPKLFFAFATLVWIAAAGWAQSPGATSIAEQVSERKMMYEQHTKRPATDENLLKSLALVADRQTQYELVFALSVVQLAPPQVPQLPEVLRKCLEANSRPLIRSLLVDALYPYDRKLALRTANELFQSSETDRGTKILIARYLLARGNLSGYPIIRDAVAGGPPRRHSDLELGVAEFLKHEGQPWNESGDKIELRALLSPARPE
jgi:hypothetical protein